MTMHEDESRAVEDYSASTTQALEIAEHDHYRTQVEHATERTQFFDKLVLGSGATIAALVSFLGAHENKVLHPHWILGSSLVWLSIVLAGALGRNWLFTDFVLSGKRLNHLKAQLAGKKASKAYDDLKSDEIGGAPDMIEKQIKFENQSEALLKSIAKEKKRWARLDWWWHKSQALCLFAVCIAMLSLVWLALANF